MTTRTRRRIFFALLVVALTVPAESILLQALVSPSSTQDAEKWVASLSETSLSEAGVKLRGYSFPYRREILRRASPEQRVKFWGAHIQDYVDAHPELDSEKRDALAAALSVLTPDALSEPSKEKAESMRVVAERVAAVLGREEASYLLIWIGPRDTPFLSSLDPIRLRLASFVRNSFTMDARVEETCDCLPDWGCGGYSEVCSGSASCRIDDTWPKCGWWWSDNCTNLCVSE